jgi:alkylation response protein AidB-like acyl-CoA dehydrogenase
VTHEQQSFTSQHETGIGMRDRELIDDLIDRLLLDAPPSTTPVTTFLGLQFDRGLAWIHFPEGLGGLGLVPRLQQRVVDRLAEAGAPSAQRLNPIGYGMVAPTLAVHGTIDQKQRFLRPLFIGEELWCQLFSEPGSGSDVAGLGTRAMQDGDQWMISGQKVWTSLAHTAAYGMLLARSDPDVPKHSGLTCFIVPMGADAVDIRPLHQITGEAVFNEVFFDELTLSDDARLGGVGDGWRVAVTTLMNERVSIGGTVAKRDQGAIGEALRLWRENCQDTSAPGHDARRQRLIDCWIKSEVGRLTNLRASQARASGTPGPEGSVAKLAFAETTQLISELCLDLLGPQGMLYGSTYPKVRATHEEDDFSDVHKAFLWTRAASIEGGTSEIMRNIIAERVLGLPGEPRSDRDIPWRLVPRS